MLEFLQQIKGYDRVRLNAWEHFCDISITVKPGARNILTSVKQKELFFLLHCLLLLTCWRYSSDGVNVQAYAHNLLTAVHQQPAT